MFDKLGIKTPPVVLAPLAGVSDHPFRRLCAQNGADLTYVEMISAPAMVYESRRTFDMLVRHADEALLGVQITGPDPDTLGAAVAMLDKMPFDTIDINMGCPVQKVVKTGCGSAALKDPALVARLVGAARRNTSKPLSVKIRIGWDRNSVNAVSVARACEEEGAEALTVHGRTRSDDYGVAVDLEQIAAVCDAVRMPVLGNGNVFGAMDASYMQKLTGCAGVMISRGALGDPWVFKRIKERIPSSLSLADWSRGVSSHISYQREAYGEEGRAAICMRKHLLWYLKGFPGLRPWKERANHIATLTDADQLVAELQQELISQGITERQIFDQSTGTERFHWDPKYEMDRQLDRGVGYDKL